MDCFSQQRKTVMAFLVGSMAAMFSSIAQGQPHWLLLPGEVVTWILKPLTAVLAFHAGVFAFDRFGWRVLPRNRRFAYVGEYDVEELPDVKGRYSSGGSVGRARCRQSAIDGEIHAETTCCCQVHLWLLRLDENGVGWWRYAGLRRSGERVEGHATSRPRYRSNDPSQGIEQIVFECEEEVDGRKLRGFTMLYTKRARERGTIQQGSHRAVCAT